MANSDKNIVITPNISSTTADPKIVFSGADASTAAQNIVATILSTNGGTLAFSGSAGQLLSISNTFAGTIFSANDVSGIPSIEVLDTGLIKLAQYGGNVAIGQATANAKLDVGGSTYPAIFITNSGYPTTFRTQLGSQPGSPGILVLGNNGVNEIRFGTTTSGGLGRIYVSNTADYNAAATGILACTFNADGSASFYSTINATTFSGALSGNASSATVLIGDESNWASYRSHSVANSIGWKNYGNAHVIFDASNGTAPNGTAVDKSTSQVPWTATYPTLMGWNGSQTYGVRVDVCRYADSAGSAGSAPANGGNADTCDGYHVTSGDTNNVANQIVRTQANGYLWTGYINSASGNEGNNSSPPRVWGTNGSDNYMRTYLTSALNVNFATSASSATTCTTASTTSYAPNRTDSTPYPIVWAAGTTSSPLYSCNAVTITSSTGTVTATTFSGALSGNASTATALTGHSAGYAYADGGTSSACSGNAATASNCNSASAQWISAYINTDIGQGTDGTAVMVTNNSGTTDSGCAAMSFHCRSYYAVKLYLRHDGYFGLGGWTAASWRWYVSNASGDMTAAGNITAYSDPRLKEDIKPIESPLAKVMALNGVKFRWKDSAVIGHPGKYDYGILSTDVQKVAPELVTDSVWDSGDGDKYKTVAYDKLTPILIEAMKEQQEEIEYLKKQIKFLMENMEK